MLPFPSSRPGHTRGRTLRPAWCGTFGPADVNPRSPGYGGILTLDLGSEERANALMDMLQNDYRFGYMAVSLGYFDTLMSCSGSTTSSEMSEEDKAAAHISPGLVRMSIGFTGATEQRWRQLHGALERLGMVTADSRGGERAVALVLSEIGT